MQVRDAVEEDADVLAGLVDVPTDVLRNLVHDRTVRVAETDDGVVAFVSYDARPNTVYVTQLGGDPETFERLLREPVRFGQREGMAVEFLTPTDDDGARAAATALGFERVGSGPRFGDEETIRFRHDPAR